MIRIPVFVINLERRRDRMDKMHQRLVGIDYTRIPAVDGRDLEGGDWQGGLNLPAVDTVNAFEYACSMSHLKAAQAVVEQGCPYACILEDDVQLANNFSKFLQSSEWIPNGVELIKCETMRSKVWVARKKLPAMDRHLCELRSYHPGTAGYFISQKGAQKMVELLSDFAMAVDARIFDHALQERYFGPILQLTPALCMQEFVGRVSNLDSDIEEHRNRHKSAVKKALRLPQKLIRELLRPMKQIVARKRHFSGRCIEISMK